MRLHEALRHSMDTGCEFRRVAWPDDPYQWSADYDEVQRLDEGRWRDLNTGWMEDDILATDWTCSDGYTPPDPLAEARGEIERLRHALSDVAGIALAHEGAVCTNVESFRDGMTLIADKATSALGPHGGGDE